MNSQQHHQGILHTLDQTGDTAVQWDTADTASVDTVREKFSELIAAGYFGVATSRTDEKGMTGTVLRDFDPAAERIVMHRRIVGG